MKPVHPGAILREDVINKMGISITKAAKGLNIGRKQLTKVINETGSISPELAVRLENGFGINAEFWLDMQKNFDIWRIKTSGKVRGIHRIYAE